MEDRMPVISSQYCLPQSITLKIDMKTGRTYMDDNVVFHVKEPSFSLHDRRVLCDGSGNAIFTLYKKTMTAHGRYQVFKGTSKELLFSVKRAGIIPRKKNIDLEVFLANNKDESVPDFTIEGGSKESCDVSTGQPLRILAKMEKNSTLQVLVHPNVDHAFVVALLMIVDEMKEIFKIEDLSKIVQLALSAAVVAGVNT